MAHEIGKTWHSLVKGNDDKDIVLTQMSNDGLDMSLCNHDGKPINGSVERIQISQTPVVHCYLVRIDEDPGATFQIQYRGIAIFNPVTNAFNKIVGVKKKVLLPSKTPDKTPDSRAKEEGALLGQDEGTWVATQP